MNSKRELSKDDRVKKEMKRLNSIYREIPEDRKKVCEGLITQAARLRILLDDMWKDICENGDTELFSQSEKTEPYERERPVARLFNARDKNYQTIIKQLNDCLPEGRQVDEGQEIYGYISGIQT